MQNMIEYRGYVGTIEFSEADHVFFGKIKGINALVSYEGASEQETIKNFHDAIDEYIVVLGQDVPHT